MWKKLDKKLGLTNQVKKIGWKKQEDKFSEKKCVKYGQKKSGKDGLNSWVKMFKENWGEKLVGKLVEKMQWNNFVDKLG